MAIIEIHSVAEFESLVAQRRDSLHGVRMQSIDLRDHTATLLSIHTDGVVFLGCAMTAEAALHVRDTGGLVFPPVPGVPFDPYRASLYTADELYAGLPEKGYAGTPDALMYEWYLRPEAQHDVFHTLLRSIHDDAMSDALTELLDGERVVGVMGGHKLARGTEEYTAAAHLGRTLARGGLVVATGGGPGAMEAANLGAYLAPCDDGVLDWGLDRLGRTPGFQDAIGAWASAGFDIRHTVPADDTGVTVGIPTFFYGHEPPNVFASHIAKYFANSIREDGLLARSTAGVVVLPGAAGTVQEIFQAATPSYYAPGDAPPIVLVDREHWTERLPAWPLLRALGSGRGMADRIHQVDSVEDVPALL